MRVESTVAGAVIGLGSVDPTQVAIVGGKGAQLGALCRIPGVLVPDGFCVTTQAFEDAVARAPAVRDAIEQLARVRADDRGAIAAASAAARAALEAITLPDALTDAITYAITAQLSARGAEQPVAVRSSATAEDSPTASFAGQHDSVLDVVGAAAVLDAVRRCWASLFTERAVSYRRQHGLDPRHARMAVIVQRMVRAQAAGVLFTADPLTGNRTITTVEATFGLGDALVSGRVTPDVFHLRDDAIVGRTRGTEQQQPALTDAQVVRLAQLGRRIEAHFGFPQDLEWCLADEDFFIVQSRPITTLFPIPAPLGDGSRVYVSVGHQQMMTDPMRPLGISVWKLIALRPMADAGGRLFVDVTAGLASPAMRAGLVRGLGTSDPLIGDALQTLVDRGFVAAPPDAAPAANAPSAAPAASAPSAPPLATDAAIVSSLIERSERALAALKRDIEGRSGAALLDFIRADIEELKRLLSDPLSLQALMAGVDAALWLNDKLHAWLGERGAADTLARSVAGNVTTEMGRALLDVADAIRPHPAVVAFLEQVRDDDDFLERLPALAGGEQARDAIVGFLHTYGARGVGEIDVTRPRFAEQPLALVPLLRGNIKNFGPGAGARMFDSGAQEAARMEREVLARLKALPDGEQKAAEAKRMIDRVRTFAGYREYPKFTMVSRTFVYKQALLREAERLVRAGVLHKKEDLFFLTFDELEDVVRTQRLDHALIRQREHELERFRALAPPRVLTSEGECVVGAYRRDNVPPGALVGLAVSAGTVEGRARVLFDLGDAELEAGDILVTPFTDPSWTPVFATLKGLVTEVGGLMTHGAVIARELGVPAVVGVQNATRLLRDGQRIRVHGAEGYVEILPDP